jgi:mono/diheme cytochrome c family protein
MMRPVALLLLALLATGCERVTHDMAEQPRYAAATASPLFADRQAARPPVTGTVASVAAAHAAGVDATPGRGRERYAIYCAPCHGADGAGRGEVVRRGFPAPPDLARPASRALTDDRLDEIIAHGVGRMAGFADRVDAADRRAVIAHLRELQRGTGPLVSSAPASASEVAR